jgi:anaphase-promoting complex subunit 10
MNPSILLTSSVPEGTFERELDSEAIYTISSAKPGNGVEQLRDNNIETYWQSDGTFPHLINVQFLRKVEVTKVCLYLNFSVDESYTPKKIAISAGTCPHDLVDVVVTELQEPSGWVVFNMNEEDSERSSYFRCHYLQVKVLSMHQNGKDTHIRQIKVFGRRMAQRVMADLNHEDFKTMEMAQYCVVR